MKCIYTYNWSWKRCISVRPNGLQSDMQPICKKLIDDVNIHVSVSQWYRLHRDRHGIGLMWNEVESIHRRILDMVFAIAIDSDVCVNTNRWHFSGVAAGIRCSNCTDQYCLYKTSSFRIDCRTDDICVSTFDKLFI